MPRTPKSPKDSRGKRSLLPDIPSDWIGPLQPQGRSSDLPEEPGGGFEELHDFGPIGPCGKPSCPIEEPLAATQDSIARRAAAPKKSGAAGKCNQQSKISAATCPICFGDLHSNRSELGALTHQGNRMEEHIYHAGCITQMLIHSGSILTVEEISWGLSPVTRKPVDGFSRMPPLSDREAWLKFIDWKLDGKIDVEELAVAVAALLPIDESGAQDFVSKTFEVDSSGIISHDVLINSVFPYLEGQCSVEVAALADTPKQEVSKYRMATPGLRLLTGIPSGLSRWMPVCHAWLHAVHVILSMHLCKFLHSGLAKEQQLRADLFEASHALSYIMVPGDMHVARVASVMLEAHDEKVRRQGVSLLGHFNSCSDCSLFKAVTSRLHHSKAEVRVVAVEALSKISAHGNATSIRDICKLLGDGDAAVVRAILAALAELAKGDTQTIEAVAARLKDATYSTRENAVKALLSIAEKGDERVIKFVSPLLQDEHSDVRRTAASSLARIAEPGNRAVTKLIAKQVKKDEDLRVVYWSLKSLVLVAKKGDRDAIDSAISRFDCENSSVRCQAIDAVAKVAVKGNRRIFDLIFPYLEDKDSHMQTHVIQAIGELAGTDDQRRLASDTIQRKFLSAIGSNPTRRRAAQLAVEELAKRDQCEETTRKKSFRVSEWLKGLTVRRFSLIRKGEPKSISLLDGY